MEQVKNKEFAKHTKELAYTLWCTNEIQDILLPLDLEKLEMYNNIPLYWCDTCKSLHIINCESELNKSLTCYCGHCYGTSIVSGHVTDWIKITKK